MFKNECLVIIIKKSKTKVICRLILRIFCDFQNFQISGFQIPENLEILWKWLFLTNCNILGIFPTQYGSLSLIFLSEYLNSHFAGISRFQIPENLEMAIFDKLQHIGYFFHLVLFTDFDFSLGIFEFSYSWNFQVPYSRFQKSCCNLSKMAISRFSGIWNLEFQQNEI